MPLRHVILAVLDCMLYSVLLHGMLLLLLGCRNYNASASCGYTATVSGGTMQKYFL